MNELALFAGGGGGIWGSLLLGHTTVCAVEIVEANRRILLQRQLDGIFPRFPIWDDVRSFNGHEWRGKVDIVSGGFPCQDISCAGKAAGISGERSGLWSEMARIIGEVRPRYAFIENSPMLVTRGLDRVLCDLAAMGFNAEWGIISAASLGAWHERERVWILAYANSAGRQREDVLLPERQNQDGRAKPARSGKAFADPGRYGLERPIHVGNGSQAHGGRERRAATGGALPTCWQGDHPEPGILGIHNGLADWRHRLFSTGNGQVPCVAAAAWRILSDRAADAHDCQTA